jgi:hypothetical protein
MVIRLTGLLMLFRSVVAGCRLKSLHVLALYTDTTNDDNALITDV